MISRLWLDGVTAFATTGNDDSGFKFTPGLNIIIGPNESGKSHLLKMIYVLAWIGYHYHETNKEITALELTNTLLDIFKVTSLGRLVRRGPGRKSAHVGVQFKGHGRKHSFGFEWNSASKSITMDVDNKVYSQEGSPLFIPSKEVLSFFPGFLSLYDKYELQLDGTYYELCQALNLPVKKGPKLTEIQALLKPLNEALHGKIVKDGEQFKLKRTGLGGGDFEMHLVAEGLRKFAMLAHLLNTGVLNRGGILLWDEPETNLNPRLLRKLAEFLFVLSQSSEGAQVIIATHSYFLLKELDLLRQEAELENSDKPKPRVTFMALQQSGEGAVLHQSDALLSLKELIILDEENLQYEREEALAVRRRQKGL